VRPAARLHYHQAALWQLLAPSQKLVALDCSTQSTLARAVNCMRMNHFLGQVHAYATNVGDQRS
jgi:hypothetical protein